MKADKEKSVPSLIGRHAIAALVFAVVLNAVPASAQSDHPLEVFVGWAPVFADNAEYRILAAWALSVSGGGIGPLSPAFEVSGWYFPGSSQSIHNFLGGPRYSFPTTTGARGFAQLLAGPTVFHAYGTAFGLALVPGGGADTPGLRPRLRLQDGRISRSNRSTVATKVTGTRSGRRAIQTVHIPARWSGVIWQVRPFAVW